MATLTANGLDISGATAARPANAEPGQPFLDTTTKEALVWDGTAWRAPGVFKQQGAPATPTTVATLTIAQLLTGILNATPTATGATVAYTLPTGTNMDTAATGLVAGDSFDWVCINNALAAADTITITANTGHTIVGNPIVQSLHASTGAIYGYSGVFRSRKTASATWITYRIA